MMNDVACPTSYVLAAGSSSSANTSVLTLALAKEKAKERKGLVGAVGCPLPPRRRLPPGRGQGAGAGARSSQASERGTSKEEALALALAFANIDTANPPTTYRHRLSKELAGTWNKGEA